MDTVSVANILSAKVLFKVISSLPAWFHFVFTPFLTIVLGIVYWLWLIAWNYTDLENYHFIHFWQVNSSCTRVQESLRNLVCQTLDRKAGSWSLTAHKLVKKIQSPLDQEELFAASFYLTLFFQQYLNSHYQAGSSILLLKKIYLLIYHFSQGSFEQFISSSMLDESQFSINRACVI